MFAIINTSTSKLYVGSSKNLSQYKKSYFTKLRTRSRYTNAALLADFHKHGEASFMFTVLEYVDDSSTLPSVAQEWLTMMSSKGDVYNVRTDVTTNAGTKRTQESKDKLRERQIALGHVTPVAKVDVDTGETIEAYETLTDAAKSIGTSLSTVHNAINESTHLCGYRWVRLRECKKEKRESRRVELVVLGSVFETYDSVSHAAEENGYRVNTIYQKIHRDKGSDNPTWRYAPR